MKLDLMNWLFKGHCLKSDTRLRNSVQDAPHGTKWAKANAGMEKCDLIVDSLGQKHSHAGMIWTWCYLPFNWQQPVRSRVEMAATFMLRRSVRDSFKLHVVLIVSTVRVVHDDCTSETSPPGILFSRLAFR